MFEKAAAARDGRLASIRPRREGVRTKATQHSIEVSIIFQGCQASRAIEWAKMMLSTAGSREALMGRQIALNYSHHHQFIQCHTYILTYILTAGYAKKNFSILHSFFSHCCVATRSQALSGQVLCHYSRWNSSSKRLTTSTAFTSHEYEVVPPSYIYFTSTQASLAVRPCDSLRILRVAFALYVLPTHQNVGLNSYTFTSSKRPGP